MKIDLFESEHIELLKRALQVYEKQQQAIATNVANAHNPDFRRRRTDFFRILEGAESESKLKINDPRHVKSPVETVIEEESEHRGVDLMEEMTLLAENQMRHEITTRFLRQKYDNLKQAITGKVI